MTTKGEHVESAPLTKDDYEALARFRFGIRQYLRFSEVTVRSHGLTPQQYQLLLALKGFPGREWATIAELAERLQLRHHSVVELVNRARDQALVQRAAHPADARAVRVQLTPDGQGALARLGALHRDELRRMGGALALPNWGEASDMGRGGNMTKREIQVRRVYDETRPDDGIRVLVDRVWPRGLTKDEAALDEWVKDVAPSTELRKWYGHTPSKFDQFRSRYRDELKSPTERAALDHLRVLLDTNTLTLLTATKDVELSQAAVLAELLRESS